ncbi:ABC transporter ATP-binding protein [Jonesiaceae bacterium BS-20]|uniref:ABC transporter ATP-binding protein n=1 Tax=Jonesiaceae bacterium BS-20 TaxID=3120821 RepID=A0AAU7DXI6_9MICO
MALDFEDVTIRRGRRALVSSVSFSVLPGTVHALLGHNGAGKTTLMRALAGLIDLHSGAIRSSHQTEVLFVGDRYPADVSVEEIIEYRSRVLGNVDPTTAVQATGVSDFLRSKGSTLSTGMAQRLSITLALMTGTQILVLDEPTAGLDPQGVQQLRQIITGLRNEGRTILVCSHDLAELEIICESVTCLRGGELSASGKVSEVSENLPKAGHILRTQDDQLAYHRLIEMGLSAEKVARGIRIDMDIPIARAIEVLSSEVEVSEVSVDRGLFSRIYDRYGAAPEPNTRRARAKHNRQFR